MKWLCCRDFVFVQQLAGECRQRLVSLICYHLHVEHTHGSLMLTWNTGSAMCHSCKVQSAKVTLHTDTHGHTRSHSQHTYTCQGSLCHPVSCSMSSFWGCWWDMLCRGYSQDHQICQWLFSLHHLLIHRNYCVLLQHLLLYSLVHFFLDVSLLGCHWFQFSSIHTVVMFS